MGIALVALAALSGPLPTGSSFQDSIVGTWMGTLEGAPLRLVFHISSSDAGELSTLIDSPDQGSTGIPTGSTTFDEVGGRQSKFFVSTRQSGSRRSSLSSPRNILDAV